MDYTENGCFSAATLKLQFVVKKRVAEGFGLRNAGLKRKTCWFGYIEHRWELMRGRPFMISGIFE